MIIPLFDMENGIVVPSSHCHAIPWLKKIMDVFPKDYLEIYKYIFYLTCPDGVLNPYYNKAEHEREEAILEDLKPTFYIEDLIIVETIRKCHEMYETPTLRAYRGAKRAYDRVATYLSETEITEGKDGTANIIKDYMKSLKDFRETCMSMEKALQEEQIKVRGDGYARYDQKPSYKSMTKDDSTEKDAI